MSSGIITEPRVNAYARYMDVFQISAMRRMPFSDRAQLGTVVGANVLWFRRKQNMTLTALAAMCGTTRQTLAKIERGESDVRLSFVQNLADALDVEPYELLVELPPASERASASGNGPAVR